MACWAARGQRPCGDQDLLRHGPGQVVVMMMMVMMLVIMGQVSWKSYYEHIPALDHSQGTNFVLI